MDRSAAVLAMLVALTGCSSNNLGEEPPVSPGPPPSVPAPPPPPPPPANAAPTANAGADVVGQPGQAITLNGGASTDPDGDTLSYSWSMVAGAGGALTQADQASASFSAAAPGTYIVEVTVRDPGNLSSTDIVVIDLRTPRSATAVTLQKLPGSLLEGSAQTVVVYLPQPAGPGGIAVTLQSSDSNVLTVPATVEIPEGEVTSAFHVDGLTAGTASISALAPGIDPASISYTVQPPALELLASTGPHGVLVGGNTTITVRLRDPAPGGGVRASLLVSETARATLSAPHVDIAAGATDGTVTLTGAASGPVNITASLSGGGAGEPLRLTILPAGVAADRGSTDLIDAALAAGTITPEQSVVYGIQAAFGDPALPAQFRGNDTGLLDSGAGRLANLRIESLPDSAQQAIGKYLFPPIYNDGWGEGITPAQTKARLAPRAGAADVSCFERLRGMPRSDTLPHWKFIRTGVFKVWYPSVLGHDVSQFNWYTAAEGEAAAQRVAATINSDFSKLSAVLGDVLRDGGVTCNGGDDAIDVYVTRIGFSQKAQVMPYLPGECARPGWMWVAPDAIPDARITRNIIGHELVHLFQLRYARPNCDDWRYGILDEATASWAFDFLYQGDKYEHQFLSGDTGTYFDGHLGEWRASPLETGAGGVRNCNGYCDYLFFEWLSRKFTPNAIRMVLDAAGTGNPQQAFQTGLGGVGGGLEQLWPRFALFMWNDWQADVQAELQSWEGVRSASIRHGVVQTISQSIEMALNGQPKRELGETLVSKLRDLRDGELPAMTTNYLHLRFTDSNVARVHLVHQAKHLKGQWPKFKLQAIEKINGQWQSAADWSGEEEKYYCRDKRAERVEELVLIYSHSEAGTEPFLHSGPTVVQLQSIDLDPELTISNASCMPWHGTTSVTARNSFGGVIRYTANVQYKLFVAEGEDPEEIEKLPVQLFVPESGTASAEVNWIEESGCRQSSLLVSGPIGELDGYLSIDFDRRLATAVGISTIQGATHRSECPGNDPIEVGGPIASAWLSFGLTGATLGDDGRTLEGSFVDHQALTGVTTTYEWNLNAQREE